MTVRKTYTSRKAEAIARSQAATGGSLKFSRKFLPWGIEMRTVPAVNHPNKANDWKSRNIPYWDLTNAEMSWVETLFLKMVLPVRPWR